jgi:heme-degrading monooxygenase HmoA
VLADLPDPPYVAVIFSAVASSDSRGYAPMLEAMRDLARRQPGFLGIESAGGAPGELEVTVSYWASEADARAWKAVAEHAEAQRLGRERWYRSYRVRVARVDRAYGFPS